MPSPGHQHHHGVRKNIVEGIGGVIIGAAAVLLLAKVFKDRRAAEQAKTLPAPAPEKPKATARKPATRRASAAKAAAPAVATKTAAKTTAKPAAKRPSRAKAAAAPEPAES